MLSKIFLCLFLFASVIFSQSKFYIQPSFFFTYGDYSNKTLSDQYSFFLSSSPNQIDYLVAGFERINLKNNSWKYEQNNYSFGLHYWISDLKLKLKADLKIIKGKYSDTFNSYSLVDNGTLFSPEVLAGVYPFYYGTGFAYFLNNGSNKTNAMQLYIRTDYYPHYKFLITILPSANIISNKIIYFSCQTSLTYYAFYELSLNTSFSLGNRKFYYHPDLMVLFNQIETQTGNYSFRLDYNFYKRFVLSMIYQKSKFSNYDIDYFVIGIKSPFTF